MMLHFAPVEVADEIFPEVMIESRLIPDSELTLGQKNALEASGLGRSASTDWASAGGSSENDEIYEMVFDSQGNIVICGSIYQVSQFGNILVEPEGEGDIFIAKISKTGTWIWAVTAGTAMYYDECRGVTVDSQDNVYGTGYFRGSVNFGNVTVNTTGFDGWMARVNNTGHFDWAKKFGGFDVDVGWDLAADKWDNLFVTGYYQNYTDFEGTELSAEGYSENSRFFIAYYNITDANWTWAKDSSGAGLSVPFQLVVDKVTNHAYVAGYNTGSESWSGRFTSNPASVYAGFLIKYNDTGYLEWGRSIAGGSCFGGACGVYFNNIVLHPTNGVVVAGNFLQDYKLGQTWHQGQGSWDIIVAWYLQNGTRQWVYDAGGAEDDRIQSLAVNGKGQVLFGGWHYDDMLYGTDIMTKATNSTQRSDFFIAQIDNDSDFLWAMSVGGGDNDTAGALLVESDGTIIAGGDFSGTVWFGSIPRSATDQDIFVWKFEHDLDNDTIPDYVDNCLKTPNLNQSNHDGDLKGDNCDTDDDNDGLHDVLDDCQYGYLDWNQSNVSLDLDGDGCNDDNEDTDDDSDGVLDQVDNCPRGIVDWTPTNLTDIDNDGCQDADEDWDDDGDNVNDDVDNCQYVVNPEQENYDSDIQGDICDPDDDDDGIVDPNDSCPMGALNWTSAAQTDKDQDGCEDEGSNEDSDDDNDGITDSDDQCPRGETGWISSQTNDRDNDGCRNDNEDNDNDNDSIINEVDLCKNGIANWRKNATNDNDGDGCLDDREDGDDDNDGFSDIVDFCPYQEGTATLGGMKGCPDFDSDGWADTADAFFQDPTQWNDGDGDGYGDNPNGNNPDDCPFFYGNSSEDRIGCIDSDGDGYSDPEISWSVALGADAFVNDPTQWSDVDGDGYGDNFEGQMVDFCTDVEGSSSIDRYGCPDTDGDGYSDADAFWSFSKWESLGYGPDVFPLDSTQWYDSDEDGFGDNWANGDWNDSRDESWPGIYLENAMNADMCPLESWADGLFDDSINYPGCPLDEVSDGGKTVEQNDDTTSSSSGGSTFLIVGIIAALIVLALVCAIVVLMKKKPATKSSVAVRGDLDDNSDNDSDDVSESSKSHIDMVESWEMLPPGEYVDPDESGTNWYKATSGEHWYQNPDETWTKWQD
jgi:hypothetical protein